MGDGKGVRSSSAPVVPPKTQREISDVLNLAKKIIIIIKRSWRVLLQMIQR